MKTNRTTALFAFGTAATIAVSGCARHAAASYPGYVEGEFVYISAPMDGRLQHLYVARGQQVAANAPLYELEAKDQQAELAQAEQQLASARARVQNLKTSRRSEEREMTAALVEQARADSALAQYVLERDQELFAKGLIPALRLEQSRTDAEAKKAKLAELTAQAQLAGESIGRREEVAAAIGEAQAATAVREHADWRLAQRIGIAPGAGLVQETYYQPGEWVPATRPIVSLLLPENIRLRFYMAEGELAGLKIGEKMRVRCDGCPEHIEATVSYISTEPEYTPPVLFSRENRARLVYRVDARPDASALPWLKAGLPVDMQRESAR
jgi:HlyD family secretion protein